MSTPTNHAFLSASSAHRWLNCTASPAFEEQFPDTTSEYAEEGTLAHAICEIQATRKFVAPLTQEQRNKLSRDLAKIKKNPLYSDEMLETASAYTNYLKDKADQIRIANNLKGQPFIAFEVKVDFSEYVPEGFGTCDCIMIGGDTLHITDYKHGKGVRVEAVGNPQMRLYALGALKKYGMLFPIKNVSMGICQPRISETESEEAMTVEQLIEWGESIKPIAQEAYNRTGTYNSGEWCKFCKGRAKCKARAEKCTALEEFKDFVPAGTIKPEIANLPQDARALFGAENILTDDEIADLLVRGAEIEEWYKNLCEYALNAILEGKAIKGFKVVAGKSNRTFKDSKVVFETLKANGYTDEQLYESKPKTLTELERLVEKKKFSELLAGQIIKPIGKPTLVPESDKREAYSAAAADFAEVV